MAGRGGVSRISICARAGQKNVVVTGPILHLLTCHTPQHGKSGQDMKKCVVLKLNNEKHQGQMPNRDDFPPAARMLAVFERQEGRNNPYIPEEQTRTTTTIRWKIAIRTWVAKLELLENPLFAGIIFIFQQIGVRKLAWTTTRRMARSAMVGRVVDTVPLSHQPLCKNLAHSFFPKKNRVQTLANVVRATWCEDSTPRTRDTDAHFFSCCAHVTVAQDTSSTHSRWLTDMWIVHLHVLIKSHSFVSCFRRTLPWRTWSVPFILFHTTSNTVCTAENGNEHEHLCYSARRSPLWPNGRTEPLLQWRLDRQWRNPEVNEDGVWVRSDVGLQGFLGDRTTAHGGVSSQDHYMDGDRSCTREASRRPLDQAIESRAGCCRAKWGQNRRDKTRTSRICEHRRGFEQLGWSWCGHAIDKPGKRPLEQAATTTWCADWTCVTCSMDIPQTHTWTTAREIALTKWQEWRSCETTWPKLVRKRWRGTKSLRRCERRNICVKRGAQTHLLSMEETSTKVTANVWKYEVDWSRVRSNRMGLTLTSQEHRL